MGAEPSRFMTSLRGLVFLVTLGLLGWVGAPALAGPILCGPFLMPNGNIEQFPCPSEDPVPPALSPLELIPPLPDLALPSPTDLAPPSPDLSAPWFPPEPLGGIAPPVGSLLEPPVGDYPAMFAVAPLLDEPPGHSPEPGTMALIGCGLLALGLLARRRAGQRTE